MKLTEEDEEMIRNFGALGYKTKTMASILGYSEEDVNEAMISHPKFKSLYDQGAAKAAYLIDMKLFELARQGDLKALEKFERRKRRKDV